MKRRFVIIKAHFDHVLVHGDPSFVTLPDTFPLAGEIADKIIYTGLVAGADPAEPSRRLMTSSCRPVAAPSGSILSARLWRVAKRNPPSADRGA